MRRFAVLLLFLAAAGCARDESAEFIVYPHATERQRVPGQLAVYETDADLLEVARFYATSYELGTINPLVYWGRDGGLRAVIPAQKNRPRVMLHRGGDRTIIIMVAATPDAPALDEGSNVSWLLVLVVYGMSVWLGRRAGIELPRRIAVFFYLLTFLFLRPALTQPVVNLPADFINGIPPWSFLTRDHRPINGEMNDLVLQIAPWAHQVRESWKAFDVPLWNHLSAAGYPLLANAQSAALSPLRLLSLPVSLGQSFAVEAALKILIALTFTFLFCRRRGYGQIASAAGAVSFGFSSFVLIWLHFPMATAAVYLPATLYMVDLIAERRTFGRIVFAAVLWASILFAGHPETAAHTFFVCLLYVLWRVVVSREGRDGSTWKFVSALGVALAIAALLAAPFLAPLADNLTKSKRYHELKAGPPHDWYYSDWPSFVVLLQPHFFGAVPMETAWGPTHAESISGFAGVLGIAAWFAVLIQVIMKRRWRSPELFFVILAAFVLGALFDVLFFGDLVTTLFHLAANTRLRLIFCLTLAVLTAAALDATMKGERLPLLSGLFAAAAILGYLLSSTEFADLWDYDSAVLALFPSLLVIAVTTAAMWRPRPYLALVIPFVIVELWTVGRPWIPNIRQEAFYPTAPILEVLADLRERQAPNDPFRIVGTGSVIFPNLSAVYGFEDVRAHDPMAAGRYVGVLRVLTGYDTADYFPTWRDLESGLLDFLNVRYVLTPRGGNLEDTQRFHLLYDGGDGRIFENTTVLPRVFPIRNVILEFRDDVFARRLRDHTDWSGTAMVETLPVETDQMRTDLLAPRPANSPEATASIISASPTRLHVRVNAPRHSMIATSISWYSGWKVRTRTRSLNPLRINGAFLGFVVPPGVHEVEIYYRPMTFWIGAALSLTTIVALTIVGIFYAGAGGFERREWRTTSTR